MRAFMCSILTDLDFCPIFPQNSVVIIIACFARVAASESFVYGFQGTDSIYRFRFGEYG